MKWSRVQNTDIACEAYLQMMHNNCHYHNLTHVESMYDYLHDTNEPYDEALDWAVLCHDVIYDDKPDKEFRSSVWFEEKSEQFPRGCNLDAEGQLQVARLILQTESHAVTNSSAIVRADLHALADSVQTIDNFVKIMHESMELYKCDLETFARSNYSFMEKLEEQIYYNIEDDPEHADFYRRVIEGIELTKMLGSSIFGRS